MRVRFALMLLPPLLLGVWHYWPTLSLGLYADDFVARAVIDRSFAAPRAPLDVFDFADGSPDDVRAVMRLGSVPWWAPQDLRISFLRPLSAALWYLDDALFGDAFWLYHAHSLFAWALCVVAAGLLYRRLIVGSVGIFALIAFALDESQHFPVLWLSNRGGLYATAAGLLTLHFHLRWRQDGWRGGAWLSGLCAAIGCLLGEWVFPLFAYVLAFELAIGPGSRLRRALSLVPVGLPAATFLVVRAVLGYGARGSNAYVDPAADPLRFLSVLGGRIPVFFADMLWNVPSAWWDHGSPWRDSILRLNAFPPHLWTRLPGWQPYHVALGVAGMLAFALLLRAGWRSFAASERRALSFLLLGALLALVPVAGAFASTRLTLGAFFGVAPAVALCMRYLVGVLIASPLPPPRRWALHYLGAVAVLYFQLIAPLTRDLRAEVSTYRATVDWVSTAELDDAKVAEQRVYLLHTAEFTSTFYFAYIWHALGHPMPRSVHPIALLPHAVDVERESSDTLLVRSLGGPFARSGIENMFRSQALDFAAGQRVVLDGMTVEVVHELAGDTRAVRVRFPRPLDDPEIALLVSTSRGLSRFAPPEPGQRVRLARAVPPQWQLVRRGRYERRMWPLPDFLLFDPAPAFVEYDPRHPPRR